MIGNVSLVVHSSEAKLLSNVLKSILLTANALVWQFQRHHNATFNCLYLHTVLQKTVVNCIRIYNSWHSIICKHLFGGTAFLGNVIANPIKKYSTHCKQSS